jgi:predicted ATPase/DNA-binding SARP family transcriptional activator
LDGPVTAELQLTLLEKPEITLDGRPVTGFVYQKSVALLGYLAVTGRPHTRAALAGLLWGQSTEANARAGLRKSLADLRKLLGTHLIISRQEVAFDRSSPYWLDVELFERGGRILAARHRDGALTDEDAAALAAAVDLYRGDLFAGFHVRRAPGFEDWRTLKREQLRLLALRMLHTVADHHVARGTYRQALVYLGRVLALEPGQEEAHRQMMSLLALTGQQGSALRQYNTCRRILAQELGVEPEQETTALYRRIRAGGDLDVRAPFPRHNLPASLTPLIGRETELAAIVTRLQDPACRLLTLVGPGGSGKTHLALEAARLLVQARRFADVFEDSVYWVSLAPLSSPRAIVPAVAQSLGLYFDAATDPRQQLLNYVRPKHLLLVLDNFEHLVSPPLEEAEGGEALVIDLLESAPGVKILLTSRVRLNLRYEYLFPLTGMDVPPAPEDRGSSGPAGPPPGTQKTPAEYGAVRLFLQTARRVQPGWELAAGELAAVAHICRRVGGMPLGILLAASWTRLLSPAEIAAHLSGGTAGPPLDLLETGWRDVPARQRSMRSVFDHSWHLLTPRAQEILAALSVFRGGFSCEAARHVTGATLRELMALIDRSLVHRAASGRYQLHELLGQYAGEKLGATPAAAPAVRDRHSQYFAAALQRWAADLKGARQQEALAEMDVEMANARAAWDWMVSQGDWARIDRAIEGLGLYHQWRVRYAEAASAFQAVAQPLSSLPAPAQEGARVWAKALIWHSIFTGPQQTDRLLQEAAGLLGDLERAGQDVRPERAFALQRLALVAARSDPQRAQRLCEQSVELYRALGARWETANGLHALGTIVWDQADYAYATQCHKESLALYRALGDRCGEAGPLVHLGAIALFQGRREGERQVREAIAIYQEIGDRVSMAHSCYMASMALMPLGAFGEAHALLDQNLALIRAIGGRLDVPDVLQSGVKVHLGRYRECRLQAERGLRRSREIGDALNSGFALMVLGWEAMIRKAYAEARACFRESVDACRSVGHQDMASWALASLAYADQALGRLDRAATHLGQALQMALQVDSFGGFVFTLGGIVLLLARRGQQERAVELHALASRYPAFSNSRWFADVVGRPLSTLAGTLPPDVVSAAEARGHARDLEATLVKLSAELDSLQSVE